MIVDSSKIVSLSEANRNFSAVARQVDRDGRTVIFKRNRPKYLVIDLDGVDYLDLSEDERIEVVARRVMRRHKGAFLELAK
jgi:antitoxin Phd